MILQEVDSEESATRWIDRPEAAAEWMTSVGIGIYPPLFVGTVLRIVRIEADP